MLRVAPSPIPENEMRNLDALWSQYARTELRFAEEFEDAHPEIRPRTRAEEIHAWEDWAFERFDRVKFEIVSG